MLLEASIRVQEQVKARRTECKGLLFPWDFQKQKIGQAKMKTLCLTDFLLFFLYIFYYLFFQKQKIGS